jgi:hypothetical protein
MEGSSEKGKDSQIISPTRLTSTFASKGVRGVGLANPVTANANRGDRFDPGTKYGDRSIEGTWSIDRPII